MTDQRKQRLRKIIQESRSRLLDSHPYFALLLMYFRYVAVPGMKKITTNGRCIYFAPEFLERLNRFEVDYVLCHLLLHVICEHIWRPYDHRGDTYHFACDVKVNLMLLTNGFNHDKYPHLGYVYVKVPWESLPIDEMEPDEIYRYLPFSLYCISDKKRSRYLADNDSMWDNKEDYGENGILILDTPPEYGLIQENDIRGAWQEIAAKDGTLMNDGKGNGKGYGDVPDSIKRIIEKMGKSEVDWKKELDVFVQEQVCDYSFAPPDRRFSDTGFFLPDFNEKDFLPKEILFMVDTSGSVDDEILGKVYSELKGVVEQFSGNLRGELGFFDVEVTRPVPFGSVSDLMNIIPVGGGGTDFRSVFDYIRLERYDDLPASVVIFTDGEGPYPDESETMGIPTLWVLHDSSAYPPFGKTIRLISPEKVL